MDVDVVDTRMRHLHRQPRVGLRRVGDAEAPLRVALPKHAIDARGSAEVVAWPAADVVGGDHGGADGH
eukprot:3094698-Prymnesium_polylepis.1